MATKDKEIKDMNAGDVIRLTIQTLRKIGRDYGILADKIIMISDLWDRDLGGYIRTSMVKDFIDYKGDRKYMTEKLLEEMKSDPSVTAEEIKEAERELAMNRVKYQAKQAVMKGFPEIGIYSYGEPGYEFDDIVTLASFMRYENKKKDVIVTTDSDLAYSLSPGCDLFRPGTKGKDPKVITYNEMWDTIPQELKDRGMSLYYYHAYMDAIGEGHNHLGVSRKAGVDPVKATLKILDGDFSDIENPDMFKAQLKSFDLSCFPRVEKVKNDISNLFPTAGKLGTLDDFHWFCKKYDVQGISDRYFSEFSDGFDYKLFTQE